MADALHPVAFEVIRALCSLYDVYIYAVYQFFTEKLKGIKAILAYSTVPYKSIFGISIIRYFL